MKEKRINKGDEVSSVCKINLKKCISDRLLQFNHTVKPSNHSVSEFNPSLFSHKKNPDKAESKELIKKSSETVDSVQL